MQIKRQLQAALMAEAILLLAAINSGSVAYAATGSPPPATRTHYWFTSIHIPEGVDGVFAYGINADGLITGFYEDSAAYYHGFLWKDGTVSTVDAPGDWADTYLGGINNSGVSIGNYDDAQTVSHATLYRVRDQTWTPLPDISGWPLNYGNAINNRGIAVGVAFDGTPTTYYNGVGWIWDGKDYSLITVPQASSLAYGTYAAGINDSGKVSGFYQDSQNLFHGFLKQGRNITSLDVPGAEDTFAYGINNPRRSGRLLF